MEFSDALEIGAGMRGVPDTKALLAASTSIFEGEWKFEIVSFEPFELGVHDPIFERYLSGPKPIKFAERARQTVVHAAAGIARRFTHDRFNFITRQRPSAETPPASVDAALKRFRGYVKSLILIEINGGGYWDVDALAIEDAGPHLGGYDAASGTLVPGPHRFQIEFNTLAAGFPPKADLPSSVMLTKAVKYVFDRMGLTIKAVGPIEVSGDATFDAYSAGGRVSADAERARTAVLRAVVARRGMSVLAPPEEDTKAALRNEFLSAAEEGFVGLCRLLRRANRR